MLLWNGYYLLFNRGIPNIKTSKAIREKTVALFNKRSKNNEDFTIYDLGSGYGKMSRDLAHALPDAQIIGVEVNYLTYIIACAMQKICGLKNLKYIRRDFKDVDLSNADGIYMFLLGTLMKGIREKLEQDLKTGTFVCSNKFKVGGNWAELKTIDVSTLAPNQGVLFVYER